MPLAFVKVFVYVFTMLSGKPTIPVETRGYICPIPGLPIERQRQMATDAGCKVVFEQGKLDHGGMIPLDRWMSSLRPGDTAWLPSILCLVLPAKYRPKRYRPMTAMNTCLNRLLATGVIVVDARAGITSQSPEDWANHVESCCNKISAGMRSHAKLVKMRAAIRPGLKARWHAPAMAEKLAFQKTIWTSAGTITDVRKHLDDEFKECSIVTLYSILGVRRPNDPKSGGRPSDNAKPRAPRVRHVYFIQRGKKREVKIGSAYDVGSRFSSLKTSSPDDLRLIGSVAGDAKTEDELHKRFEKYWIRREWFRLEGDLAAFIRQLPKPKSK